MNFLPPRIIPALIYGCIVWIQAIPCSAQDGFELGLSNDQVSLNAENAELNLVLQELSAQAGFKLWLSDNLPSRQVNLQTQGQSIEATLRQLLAESSYALVYDDNSMVSALYVVPPGESQPINLELEPGVNDIQQSVLQNALESKSLPDNVKAALLNQFNVNRKTKLESLALQPTESMQRVIELLEQIGSASPTTMEQLRNKLELKNTQQPE